MIEEDEFRSIVSVARRVIDVYGRPDDSELPRVSHVEGELTFSSKRGVLDIFYRGGLVFRHDPRSEVTDFFETGGEWIDEVERIGSNLHGSSTGIATQKTTKEAGQKMLEPETVTLKSIDDDEETYKKEGSS